jgi:hypothetical protein
MRTRAIAVGAVVAAALAVLTGLALGSGTAAKHPRLRLAEPAPLEVRGLGFRPQERVRVVAGAGHASVTRRARASRRGSFAVAFAFAASHCSGLSVVAIGNAGSRATLKRPPLPACMPS